LAVGCVALSLRLDNLHEPNRLNSEWQRLNAEMWPADEAWTGPLQRRPLFQLFAAMQCLALRPEIESGDGGTVLEAVAHCATHGLVMPAWLAGAFVGRYQRVVMGECKEWSDAEAFGRALRDGENVAGVHARRQLAPWAYETATRILLKDPKTKIEKPLYEEIGRKIGKSATRVQELIAEYLRDGHYPPLSFVKDRLQENPDLAYVLIAWNGKILDKALKDEPAVKAEMKAQTDEMLGRLRGATDRVSPSPRIGNHEKLPKKPG
jgi:hypothetical protein